MNTTSSLGAVSGRKKFFKKVSDIYPRFPQLMVTSPGDLARGADSIGDHISQQVNFGSKTTRDQRYENKYFSINMICTT